MPESESPRDFTHLKSEDTAHVETGDDAGTLFHDEQDEYRVHILEDDFMHTPDFKHLLVDFLPIVTLFKMQWVSQDWRPIALKRLRSIVIEDEIDDMLIVHGGRDLEEEYARTRKIEHVTKVFFFLNTTKVGNYAFWAANYLKAVDIPEGVERIGCGSFCNCTSLTTVSFPTTLRSINSYAFSNCLSIENVHLLHTKLESMGSFAFECCTELKSMTVPESLQKLGRDVFEFCHGLAPSNVGMNVLKKAGWNYGVRSTMFKTIEWVPTSKSFGYPHYWVGHDVTHEIVAHLRSLQSTVLSAPTIGSDFMNTNDFRRLFIEFCAPDTVINMRFLSKAWHAVVEKKLSELVDEPQPSEVIVGGVVHGFGSTVIHGGNDTSSDEAWALRERRRLITQVVFLLNITKVGDRACSHANLIVVEIPEGVESIGDGAFASCSSLTTVSFPTTLKSIGRFSFSGCSSLDNVDLLHTQLQEIGRQAFYNCTEFTTVSFPTTLTSIGGWAFAYCRSLETVDLHHTNLRELAPKTFWWCSNLISMTIPASLTNLDPDAFQDCPKLVPKNIVIKHPDTDEVDAHLRSLRSLETKKVNSKACTIS